MGGSAGTDLMGMDDELEVAVGHPETGGDFRFVVGRVVHGVYNGFTRIVGHV